VAKHLTDSNVADITKLTDEWSLDVKFTWDKFRTKIQEELGIHPTRQTLETKTRIYTAYLDLKKNIRDRPKTLVKPKSVSSLAMAATRIDRLEVENNRLKREQRNLLEQFRVWQYNAYANGLTEHQLNAPLPPMKRS